MRMTGEDGEKKKGNKGRENEEYIYRRRQSLVSNSPGCSETHLSIKLIVLRYHHSLFQIVLSISVLCTNRVN